MADRRILALYSHFGPGLHTHVMATKKALLDHRLLFLRDTFSGSAFAASEAFLGSAESPPRLDDRDMLWCWRALTGLGRYDPEFGGEMILWDEKKVIKFPVGSTFLFPAAFMRYSFTRVRPWERRFSFSQYSQAGLFRYVENGFMSEATFEATAWRSVREKRDRVRDARMQTALGMFSHLNDFA
ncbi:hypothetical protein B0H11DRAFT_1716213 [Mycena galericulata]|nr:hypothetical protein B0H11DRAFT_1716213 [Mycena galericulata]